jgi:hypothetical protein
MNFGQIPETRIRVFKGVNQFEKAISAQKTPAQKRAWLPQENENQKWTKSSCRQKA